MSCCSRLCCVQDPVDVKSENDDDGDSHIIYIQNRPNKDDNNTAALGNSMASQPSRNSVVQWNIAIYEGTDDDPQFTQILMDAEAAIENEILPERIYQGSSGSYFVKNMSNEKIGVFKPKDEEPYGIQNPKWGKWFQRRCCPCCFGRACLIPNTGYLSEAGAFLVDQKFGLCVVPKTKVIRMASTTFHYGKIKRGAAQAKTTMANKFPAVGRRFNRIGLPLKIGSFQIFVKGYKDAVQWLQQFDSEPLPPDVAHEFQLEFERLVMLDYIIRNTDRGHDNWLIRYDKKPSNAVVNEDGITISPFSEGSAERKRKRIKVAAIDNGLAFPFKHPDEIRAYPFQWAKLPYAKIPFSRESRDQFLPLLSNINVIEELCSDLYCLFSLDKKFQKRMFEKQMSVMRGQVLNLANALRDRKSPCQLAQMPNVRVLRSIDMPSEPPNHTSTLLKQSMSTPRTMKISPANTLMFDDEYKPEFPQESPLFTSW